MTKRILGIGALFFLMGLLIGGVGNLVWLRDSKNKQNLPYNRNISIDSTNLPIVFIHTENKVIEKESYIMAKMKIIDNVVAGGMNYGDTVNHLGQNVDYEGYIEIKYRGSSSYLVTPKKSFAIRPVNKKGKRKKVSLLGMKADKKYVLSAIYKDQSLMRDMLTYELARPYFDYVPQGRYCEVILNGTYYGVFLLLEQLTLNRIGEEKPDSVGDITGGYILYINRGNDNGDYYVSKSLAGEDTSIAYIEYKEPKRVRLSHSQKEYIDMKLSVLDKSTFFGGCSENIIDTLSFIDYQLTTEFVKNKDGYRLSTYMYKHRDNVNPCFKMSLWDFDITYGNAIIYRTTEGWVYLTADSIFRGEEPVPGWWRILNGDENYRRALSERWLQYRQSMYAKSKINTIIDSLSNELTKTGAYARNAKSWFWWSAYSDYVLEEEVQCMKNWIWRRLEWMDENLILRDSTTLTKYNVK